MSGNDHKLPRGRRSAVSTLVSLVILVGAALGAVAAIQLHQGHGRTVLGDATSVTGWLHERRFDDAVVLTAGIVVAVIGLLLLLAGLLPARRSMLRLADPQEHTILGIERSGLTRDLTATAAAVDGVTSAKVRLRGRRVRVRARSALREHDDLTGAVQAAVTERVDSLEPVKPIRVRTRVAGK